MELALTYGQTVMMMFMLAIFTAIYGIYHEIRRLQHHLIEELDAIDAKQQEDNAAS
jgi:fructoselysine-6-P-deglycase FrlB-like protein